MSRYTLNWHKRGAFDVGSAIETRRYRQKGTQQEHSRTSNDIAELTVGESGTRLARRSYLSHAGNTVSQPLGRT
jgi:hypothetical protein